MIGYILVYRMRTKLACTVGPSSSSMGSIKSIMEAGCRIFRINLSHGNVDLWREWAGNLRLAGEELGYETVLITDLKGPSVRFMGLQRPRHIKAGERFNIVMKDLGDGETPVVDNSDFFSAVAVGDVIVTDDGRGLMEAVECGGDRVYVKALTEMVISNGKSLVVRGRETPLRDYLKYNMEQISTAISIGADFLGLSYIRSRDDVESVRRYLDGIGSRMGLISKVETPSAVANVDGIAEVSDAVLVARGDLGMHFPLETVPILQKEILEVSFRAGRPAIVATQLLGSMMNEPIPSRSEIVDIMNCVEYGVDVLMLTGETAVGRYPVDAVIWLKRVVETYENNLMISRKTIEGSLLDRFALGVVELAEVLDAKIGVYTKAGNVARRISRYKPRCSIFAGSGDPQTIKLLMLLWGVTPIRVDDRDYAEGLESLMAELTGMRLVGSGDTLILTYGLVDEPVHIIKIVKVS